MVVESTADILAILGGVTTFIISVFGVIRYSRCTEISCCGIKCHRNVVDKKQKSDGSESPKVVQV